MSFLNAIFGGGGQQEAPAAQQPTQAHQPGSQGTPGQPSMPQNNGQANLDTDPSGTGAQNSTPNPLDTFRGLYDNKGTQDSNTPQSMRIPKDKLGEVAGQLDFSQAVSPEALEQLQNGDFSGFAEILNSVGRSAYSMALDHSTGVTEHYLNNRLATEQANYAKQARVSTVESQLNIADLEPVAQDMFRETARRVASAQPNLNSKEVEEQTWQMMQAFSNQFNRQGRQSEAAKPKEINYDQLGGWD